MTASIPSTPTTTLTTYPTSSTPSVAMTRTVPAVLGASTFEADVPAKLYQTKLTPDGRQDSSSLQKLTLALSKESGAALAAAVSQGKDVSSLVHGAVRRFDMTELQQFDEATGAMLGLRLPAAVFEYDLQGGGSRLSIGIHRKELPVSRSYGDSPFVFVFIILPTNEVCVTTPVVIGSKQPTATAPRPKPKRPRAPPPTRPVVAPADGTEATINALLSAKRVRVVEPVPEPLAAVPPLPTMPGSPTMPECPSPYFALPSPTGADVLDALPVDLLLDW